MLHVLRKPYKQFITYCSPLTGHVISKQNVVFHFYANDIQLCMLVWTDSTVQLCKIDISDKYMKAWIN